MDTARQLARDGKYPDAEEKLKLVLLYVPDLPDAYFLKGVLEYYQEDYAHAFKHVQRYEDKIIAQIKPQYPAIQVNGVMKNLYRIRDIGLNTVDLYEIKSFFEKNQFPLLVEATDKRIKAIFIKYENIIYSICPGAETKMKDGGIVLNFEKIKNKTHLSELLSIPITEINLENSGISDVSFLNKLF